MHFVQNEHDLWRKYDEKSRICLRIIYWPQLCIAISKEVFGNVSIARKKWFSGIFLLNNDKIKWKTHKFDFFHCDGQPNGVFDAFTWRYSYKNAPNCVIKGYICPCSSPLTIHPTNKWQMHIPACLVLYRIGSHRFKWMLGDATCTEQFHTYSCRNKCVTKTAPFELT